MPAKTKPFTQFRLVLLIVNALLLGCSGVSIASEPLLKVGFIGGSAVGTHGWTYSHDLCRLAVKDQFASQVETSLFAKDAASENEVELVMRSMLEDGIRMIFIWSYEFETLAHQFAKQYLDAVFEIATGATPANNVATYSARFYEGRFSSGVLAGSISSTGKIGYIAPFPIPEVVRGVNATALGARKVNPQAQVYALWTGSWRDAEREATAANILIENGVDVIMIHTSGHEPLMIAERKGVFGFGKASDMSHFAPNAHLAAISNDWNPYCINRVQAVLDGSWESSNTWGGVDGPAVRLTHYNRQHVGSELMTFVQDIENDVLSGKTHPFTGPIYDNKGNLVIEDSQVLTDADLRDMDWFVEGVTAN